MFSYRHSFHAGNHADIFKHMCLSLLLGKLREKSKPFVYMDTHSGAGRYDLSDETALKTGEYRHGVKRFIAHTAQHPDLADFQDNLTNYFAVQQYPGSPQLAKDMMREQDHMVCMEWHNSEIVNLKRNLRGGRVTVHHRDGFEGLIALTPPTPGRGLVLIDPPYERTEEYTQVVTTLSKALPRWQTGIYAIWLPLLSERAGDKVAASEKMIESFSVLPAKNVFYADFCPQRNTPDAGMYGSAMIILNCPWQVDEKIRTCSVELLDMLAGETNASASQTWLKEGE